MTRALSGETLPRINRLVDIYNAVSVQHAIPVGGEDLDRVAGPVRLAAATGDEPFDDDEYPRPGEIVWADTLGVTCRRWNWRQCRRTRLVEGTTRAYFLFDALPRLQRRGVGCGDGGSGGAPARWVAGARGCRRGSWGPRRTSTALGRGSGVSPGVWSLDLAIRGSSDHTPAEPTPQCRS